MSPDELVTAFFRSVSFESGETPTYERIRELFIERGLLIKNTGSAQEVTSVDEFIAPRAAQVASGSLTRFLEVELTATTSTFGRVAHRLSTYAKSGELDGAGFEGRGVISTQFVLTDDGWRMSSMAWDDEREGLTLADLSATAS